jgi:transposase-like protein
MPAKNPPTRTDRNLNLATLSDLFTNEDAARAFVESKVWADGRVCPHCGCAESYTLTPKPGSKSPVRKGVYKCKDCRKQFTVRIGTIFEDSKLPFTMWLMVIHLMTSSKKGISSLQISRELGIKYKSAWFMTHRIREAMRFDGPRGPMGDIVEVDETYVGGKPRRGDGKYHKRGHGSPKQPVLVLVEREGGARCKPIEKVDAKTLHNEIAVNVAKTAIIMTDELFAYRGIRDDGSHRAVKHGAHEYGRVDPDGVYASTNTAESFFALLKRGHYGVFHQLSKKHLHRYCNEFSFRWTHRKVTDGERMVAAVKGVSGKRLMYVQPSAKEAS